MLLLLHLPLRLQQGAAGLQPSSFSSEQRSASVLYILSSLRTAVEGCLRPSEQQESSAASRALASTPCPPQQGSLDNREPRTLQPRGMEPAPPRGSPCTGLPGAGIALGNALPGLCRRKGQAERCRLGTWSLPGMGQSEPVQETRWLAQSWHKAMALGSPSRATPHRSPAPLTEAQGRLCWSGCSQQHHPSHTHPSSSLGCPKASPASSSPF